MKNDGTTTAFCLWLKQRRKELDLTQGELARLIGYSAKAVEKLEAGERRPSKQIAELLAECLDIPLEEHSQFVEFARVEMVADQLTQPAQADGCAPWRSLHRLQHPNNLPAQPNSFIGRSQELAATLSLLRRPGVRLLTLTGPPGIGKTRLALQLATTLIGDFSDGVFLVSLAAIADPALVIPTIVKAMRVHEEARRPLLESLNAYLQDRQILLFLDNFEQVAAAAPSVSELLRAAPQLKIICTSQLVLHLYGEHDFQVPPLALPNIEEPYRVEGLAQYEAVRLFTERAQAARPDFAITPENALVVADICRRLDGLPLAIELAAARIKLLNPQAVLARLQSRLGLLSSGARDLPVRQQTLRGAIEWSYELLADEEKKLFRRLSVFVGGCTLDAAEIVCNAEGDLEIDILEGLAALLDKSLLRQEEALSGKPRYRMLETIREYALEKLEKSSDAEGVRNSHLDFFWWLAEDAEPRLKGAQQAEWLSRLEAEYDNLRAALAWSQDSGQVEAGLGISSALFRFWDIHAHYTEGLQWLASFLRRPAVAQEGSVTASGVRAEQWKGYSATPVEANECDANPGERQAPRGMALRARALFWAGTLACRQGNFEGARSYYEESLAIHRCLRDKQGSANTLNGLGVVASEQEDHATARSLLEESLAIHRELGDNRGVAASLANLGEVARCQGDYTSAYSLYSESLAIWRELEDKNTASVLLHNLAHVALHQGDYGRAAALFVESLETYQQLGNKQAVAECVAGLAGVANAQGEPLRAAKLFGAAEALRAAISSVFAPADRAEYEYNLASSRAQLGEEAWQAAWEEGLAMTNEQAIFSALEIDPVRA